jgi:benzoylformate decarboxylase
MVRLAPAIREILERHDVLFSVGGDLFTLSLPSDVEPVPPGMPIVHLDADPWELGKNHAAAVAILGDPKHTLPELAEAVSARANSDFAARAASRRDAARGAAAAERDKLRERARSLAEARPVQPLALLHAIAEALPPDAVVVEEALSSGTGLRQLISSDDPKSFFGMRGGGIGWSLPAAVGVKLAQPERPVVAIVGDGSALYTCQALWTAAHENLSIAFVILNNGSYRILKQRTKALRGYAEQTGTYVAMDLTDPPIDFLALARSFGLRAERAETVAEAVQALRGALDGTGPTLIDVMLDPSI